MARRIRRALTTLVIQGDKPQILTDQEKSLRAWLTENQDNPHALAEKLKMTLVDDRQQVDPETGEMLVGDGKAGTLSRWLGDDGRARKPTSDEVMTFAIETLDGMRDEIHKNRNIDQKKVREQMRALEPGLSAKEVNNAISAVSPSYLRAMDAEPIAPVEPVATNEVQQGVVDQQQPIGEQQQVQAVTGEQQADQETKLFAPETGTLGVPREEMPQVPTQTHGGLVKHLNAQGIQHETTTVDAGSLKPTQAEYSPEKVEKSRESAGNRSIIVSNDGHIIDGHHQALAAAEDGKPVKAIVLDAPVEKALEAVKGSPSAKTGAEAQQVAQNVVADATAPTAEGAASYPVTEYTTSKGKTLLGTVRHDLTHAQAKAIDPFTMQHDGGFFIREKHFDALRAHDVSKNPEKMNTSAATSAENARNDAGQTANREDGKTDGVENQAGKKIGGARGEAAPVKAAPVKAEQSTHMATVESIAGEYGYTLEDGVFVTSAGNKTRVSVRIENGKTPRAVVSGEKVGKLWTGKPEKVGDFLESYWFAEKKKPAPTPVKAANESAAVEDVPTSVQSQATTTATTEAAAGDHKEASTPDQFAGNKLFTSDKVAAAKARMRAKLGQVNSGLDPELLMDGMTIAGAYIESGVRKFSEYAKAMVADLGDGVRPYLLSFYEGVRHYPGLDTRGMSSQEEAVHQYMIADAQRAAAAGESIAQAWANVADALKIDRDDTAMMRAFSDAFIEAMRVENTESYAGGAAPADVFRAAYLKAHGQDRALPDASYQRAAAEIMRRVEAKDADGLIARNLGDAKANPASRAVFESATGIKLPNGRKAAEAAIDAWAGITPEQRAAKTQARKDSLAAAAAERSVAQARRRAMSITVNLDGTGEKVDGAEYVAVLCLQLLQQLDRCDVAIELTHCPNASEIQLIGDGEVAGRDDGRWRRAFLGAGSRNPGFGRGFFGFSGLWGYSFSGIPYNSRTSAWLRWLFCCANRSAISS